MKRLRVLLLISVLFMACAQKQSTDYVSAIPETLDVDEYIEASQKSPQFVIEMDQSCGWEKVAVPNGTLTTEDGRQIKIKAGVLISNCKTEQLIKYKSAAELFYVERNQIAIAYKAQFEGCKAIEKNLQERIAKAEGPGYWEQVDCEACFAAGAATCIGIVYGLAPAMKDK